MPVLPLPFTLPAASPGAAHPHVIVPYAALHNDSCQLLLRDLPLPHLAQLLQRLSPSTVDHGTLHDTTAPHERVVARAWGLQPQAPAWAAIAQPSAQPQPCAWMTLCHWTAGADQVRMDDPAALPLELPDAQALHALLQPWFAEDGLSLHIEQPGRWLICGAPLQDWPAASLDRVLLRDVSQWLPHSAHSRTLHRLHSEVQMLLYTHPFNAQRAQRGLPPVNAFWLHGAGQLDAAQLPAAQQAQRDSALVLIDSLRQAALRQDWPAWKAAWLAADAGPLQQLLAHVQAGGQGTLSLCGAQHARSFTTTRRSWLGRIKNHFQPQRFAGLHQAL